MGQLIMNSLITGSNGFIGSHLVEQLLKLGHQVFCFIRKTSNLKWLQGLPVHYIYGDIKDTDALIKAIDNKNFIFHLGGTVRACSEAEFYQVNYQGTYNLLQACRQKNSSLQRFIFISSQAAAGPSSSQTPINELHLPNPISIYGKSKLKAEQAVQDFAAEFPVTIIRPPSVYGPRDDDVFQFFKIVKTGFKLSIGTSDKYVSLIFINDLINGIIKCFETHNSIGQTYFLANPELYSVLDIENVIAQVMSRKALTIRIPELFIDMAAFTNEMISHITKKPALLNKDKALEMKQPYWLVDSAKAKNDFEFTTQYSLIEGMRETYLWYKQNKWL
jgi:nucleoside-diphosphate-sugar epimerase